MKKILLFASALAGLFLAGSCQRENLEPVQQGNTVTYTVTVPDALATKGIGDNVSNVNTLHYEVYRTAAANTVEFTGADRLLYHETATVTDGKAKIELELVNDQNFTVLFWAHVQEQTEPMAMENEVYDVTNLTAVTIKTPINANKVDYAAFSGVDFIKGTDALTDKTIQLTRPVAQINLGTTEASLTAFNTPITLAGSSMTVVGLSNTFDVAQQAASGTLTSTTEYDEEIVPTVKLTVNSTDYVYVGMNYAGFAPEDGTPVTVSYDINTTEGHIQNTIENVPVKPNYRTNIIGNLITSKTAYTIKLDETWGTPEEVVNVVNTAAGLQEAIDNAEEGVKTEIKLEGDIDLNDLLAMTKAAVQPATVVIEAGKNIVLDLNGFSLTATDETEKNYSIIDNRGTLVVKNSKEGTTSSMTVEATVNSGWNRYSAVLANNPGGHLTVESGVVIKHLGGTDMAYGIDNLTNGKGTSAVTVINGATVESPYRAVRQFLNGVEANNSLTVKSGSVLEGTNKSIFFHDPSANANNGTLEVEEGAQLSGDVYLFVTAGSTEWPVEVSIPSSTLQDESTVLYANVPAGYEVEKDENGIWTVSFHPVAMIGDKGYWSLNAAVAAVEDGGTITLVANETFTENNRYDNGGWWDGLGYSGDKSFTIDLGGHTIKQDGSLNDYLMWIKNDGAKANTITLKNGTLDAGKTAYCALATSSSNKQTITINLENINLINNNTGGAVAKIRGGSVLNVKAGTIITGQNSYTGIEAVGNNTVVNIYDGAEIYQKGTSNYVGAIVGASYNATLNIYGGKGQSAKCGIIVMSTGATINVSGGEWTANNDGTVSNDNAGVLVSQNNRYETGWACKSILNVTGGTFKGGYNCYGMGPGVEADDAQINIKGGNFNANPANYVVAGYEATENAGTYTVAKPAALQALEAALANGGNVTLTKDVTLLEPLVVEKNVNLDLNGKTITAPLFSAFEVKAGGELTVKNGKVVAYESTVRAIGGKVTIESGEYTSTGTALDSPSTYRYSLDCREGGELIINGGTFKSNNGMINVGSSVTINGGKFENIVEKSMTRHFAYVSAPLTINDGEFYGKANSSGGGCFFCGAGAGGDIQVKGGKFTSLWTSGSVNRIFEVYFGGTINVTGGMFNTNGGIATFVTENTDEATKAAYPYVAK